jgi:hypothetical protein
MTPVTSQNAGVLVSASAPIIRAVVIVVSLKIVTLVSEVHDAAPPPPLANAGGSVNTLNTVTHLSRTVTPVSWLFIFLPPAVVTCQR